MWYVLHQEEGPPIHSERLLHHGSARDVSNILVVYAGVTALVLPIKWSLFFAGNIIGLALPSNLLVMDGINPGGGKARYCFGAFIWKISSLSFSLVFLS